MTREGLTPIIVETDSHIAEQIYQKIIEWDLRTYNSPDDVLIVKREFDLIRKMSI